MATAAQLRADIERLKAERGFRHAGVPADRAEFARSVGYDPDPWQHNLLRSEATRVLINASRQSGKSSMAAVIAMHRALDVPGSAVLVLSPALRQSAELYRKCAEIYAALGRPVPADSETKLSLTLSNGSRVLSLPGRTGDTVRGYTADLLTLSTPAGKRGWWFEAWNGGEGWERYEVRADECPRIPASFLEEERRALPAWIYRQEYECSFEDTEDQLFGYELVKSAITDEVTPLFEEAAS